MGDVSYIFPELTQFPAVTAIVNTWNRPAMLDRALASIAAQTFRDFEVIAVHDGPPSRETSDVFSKYDAIFEAMKINIYFSATGENSGYQCVPKNLATELANGDYVAYLDDDNEWTANHLEVLVNAIEEGDVWPDFVYGKREYVFDEGAARVDKHGNALLEGISAYTPFTNENAHRLTISPMYNFIDTSDALISKGALWRLYKDTGTIWNEQLRRFGDWEFFTRGVFFGKWRGKGVDEVVQRYHWHGGNLQLTRPYKSEVEFKNA